MRGDGWKEDQNDFGTFAGEDPRGVDRRPRRASIRLRRGRGAGDAERGFPRASSLKLYVFDCGYAPVHDLELFSLSTEEVAFPELFIPCYLIEHSGGRLLWDAGVPAIVADSPEGMEVYGFFTKLDRTLADQFAELGIGGSDVDLVAFSHMHWERC